MTPCICRKRTFNNTAYGEPKLVKEVHTNDKVVVEFEDLKGCQEDVVVAFDFDFIGATDAWHKVTFLSKEDATIDGVCVHFEFFNEVFVNEGMGGTRVYEGVVETIVKIGWCQWHRQKIILNELL